MIYEVTARPGSFVISCNHSWLPGVYSSRKAARYAFQFSYDELRRLMDEVRPNLITTEDLARVAAARKKSERKAKR